jgi:hypothetical protein
MRFVPELFRLVAKGGMHMLFTPARTRRNRPLWYIAAASLSVLLAGSQSFSQEIDADEFIPVSTSINALMVALVDHSAHQIWEAGSATDLTDRDWETAEQHAIQLAASGTLISLGGTGIADAGWVSSPAWQDWARKMTDAALAARAAIQAYDQESLNAVGSTLLDTCQGCHLAFKPEVPTEGLFHIPHYEFTSQQTVTLKSAVVALAQEPELRAEFEDRLVAKALALNYNAVTSYDLVPDVTDVDDADFIKRLVSNGVGAVLMVRPAAVGPGSTLESVKDAVSPSVYSNMRAFARELSPSGEDDLLEVVHLGLYLISVQGAELISSGAVWLDEPYPTREEGLERLQNLIAANINRVRPAIREHLGLPPLQ